MKLDIVKHRKRLNLTQAELAQKIGVSFQSISKWETGTAYPDLFMCTQLADIFEITLDELVGRSTISSRKDTKSYWGREIEYLKATRETLWNDDYFEFLVRKVWQLNKPINVIDYGCGYGYIGLKLMPLLPEGSTYTGIEINPDLIDEANKLFNNSQFKYEFIQADVYEHKTDQSYDLAICQGVMRHMNHPEILLKKMFDAIKKGGQMIAIEVNRPMELVGFYQKHLAYDPFAQMKAFEVFWTNEHKNGGRDFAIGIKLPSLFHEIGLEGIDVRLNDCVNNFSGHDVKTSLIKMKHWQLEKMDQIISGYKMNLSKAGVSKEHVSDYVQWLKENIQHIQDSEFVTSYRGLIITSGYKSCD